MQVDFIEAEVCPGRDAIARTKRQANNASTAIVRLKKPIVSRKKTTSAAMWMVHISLGD